MRVRVLVLSAATWVLAGAASADVMADLRVSGNCWARTYDAAHLRTHRGQHVRAFMLGDGGVRRETGVPVTPQLDTAFGFRVAGSEQLYGGLAVCRAAGAGALCAVEGDGGHFRLDPLPGRTLRLTITDRLQVEGDVDFSPELGRGQDRVFDLARAPETACQVESAETQ